MTKKYNIIEVVEAEAVAKNEVFPKNTIITFYNDTSKIKIADGKTKFNSLGTIGGGGAGGGVTSVNGDTGPAVVLTKANIGLGNVDNTSDANKPVSTAVSTALTNKVDKDGTKVLSDVNFTVAKDNKLTGIASGATANQTDAFLLARANHIGTQAATTIVEDSTHRFATDAEKASYINNTTDTFTSTPPVKYIVTLTNAEYTAIVTKDTNTQYLIIG